MTNKEKLHQILSSLWKNDDSVGKTYYNQALQDVQTAIDLQQEPVSEDLERAALINFNRVLEGLGYKPSDIRGHDYTDVVKLSTRSFENGANWRKQQLMAKAVDGFVIEDIEEGNGDFLLSADYLSKDMGLKDRQKVKVIVIKEG